jgi:hypothetical protein
MLVIRESTRSCVAASFELRGDNTRQQLTRVARHAASVSNS